MMKFALKTLGVLLLLFSFGNNSVFAGGFTIEEHIQIIKQEVLADRHKYKLDKETIDKCFASIELDDTYFEKVINKDKNQPEFKLTFTKYKERYLNDWTIDQAKKHLRSNYSLLERVEKRYKVPKHYIVAFWAAESSFGKLTGDYHLLSAIMALVLDGRRETLFKKQLIAAMQIIQKNKFDPKTLKGSWAGGMGNFQFIPTTFRDYAVDFDHDGKTDLWNSKADSFASAAHYLSRMGWKYEEKWGREIRLPKNFNRKLLDNENIKKTVNQWARIGVIQINGRALPKSNIKGRLISATTDTGKRYFLVYKNFDVIRKWNRSDFYALSVGSLATQIR